MESLTRLVTDSLVRHGFDRPVDPRRLQWSSWSRCDSVHSLLTVPSRPGIFAIAEEVTQFGRDELHSPSTAWDSLDLSHADTTRLAVTSPLGGAALQCCHFPPQKTAASAAGTRMLAVLQFSEDDDMAFTLDRMFTCSNPMRARLSSGRCFLRFVVLEDPSGRRSICAALNQWLLSSAEKASGLPAGFSSSVEINLTSATTLDSGCNRNLHCSPPLPSGF